MLSDKHYMFRREIDGAEVWFDAASHDKRTLGLEEGADGAAVGVGEEAYLLDMSRSILSRKGLSLKELQ